METVKISTGVKGQTVHLPNAYRFEGNEVGIKKSGNIVILYPPNHVWETFLDGLNGFTEDFMKNGREEQIIQTRENI